MTATTMTATMTATVTAATTTTAADDRSVRSAAHD
jgi:hypothetical protein